MDILIPAGIVLLVAILILQVILLRRGANGAIETGPLQAQHEAIERAQERAERGLRDEMARNREEFAKDAHAQRQELQAALAGFGAAQTQEISALGEQVGALTRTADEKLAAVRDVLDARLQSAVESLAQGMAEMRRGARQDAEAAVAAVTGLGSAQSTQLTQLTQATDGKLEAIRGTIDARMKAYQEEAGARLETIRGELSANVQGIRAEVGESLKGFNDSVVKSVNELGSSQAAQLSRLTETTDQKLEVVRNTVHDRLKALQEENTAKLEQIRHTVDEQLQTTLEKRLGESFQIVSERLEQVHRGLGEMQTLASGVGDLKKLLSNVRARGTWGEVQLGMLLEQVLTPDQYGTNVATTGTGERVEFAIRLPGSEPHQPVWLPIDAKFPKEDYERLLDAVERADAAALDESARQLEVRIRQCARDIARKYVEPPKTTDFAIMYLPSEALYAEVLRRPGLAEALQHDFRVTAAGPMTLAAMLNSLQMGFRTLAIQQRSSEVWEVLGEVKTEFSRYSEILAKVQKKLQEANNTVEAGLVRTRVIQKKLKNVQELTGEGAPAEVEEGEELALALGPVG